MEINILTEKIRETFPRAAFEIDSKRGNIRIHFRIEDCFIPPKWMLCNALNLPLGIVKFSTKKFKDPLFDNKPSKLFTIINGVYLDERDTKGFW